MNKLEITEAVIEELELTIKIEHALKMWWWPDSGEHENNRLTKPGLNFISKVVTGYQFDIEFENTGVMLNRLAKLNTAFYIDRQNGITIFSSKLATMIKMYPSFDRYLELINT